MKHSERNVQIHDRNKLAWRDSEHVFGNVKVRRRETSQEDSKQGRQRD